MFSIHSIGTIRFYSLPGFYLFFAAQKCYKMLNIYQALSIYGLYEFVIEYNDKD